MAGRRGRTRRGVATGGGGSPVPGLPLALWLRADQGITLNGANVSQWNDQSGNGRHFSQGTSVAQPLFVASETDFPIPRPAVNPNASQERLVGPVMSNIRWIGVVAIYGATTFASDAVLISSTVLANGYPLWGVSGAATWRNTLIPAGTNTRFRDGTQSDTALTDANAPHFWELVLGTAWTSPGLAQVGTDVAGLHWNDSISMVLMSTQVPTPVQLNSLYQWLNDFYGLSIPVLPQEGLRLWLDSASPNITLNGANVSGWADGSGLANHATQTTAAAQPLYETTGWNSAYPSVLIEGETNGEFLIADSLAPMFSGDDTPYTINWVGQVVGNPTNLRVALCVGSDQNDFALVRSQVNASDQWGCFTRDDANSGSRSIDSIPFDTNRHQHTLVFDGTTLSYYIDGILMGTSATAQGVASMARYTLGGMRRSTGALETAIDVRLVGVQVYNRALAAAELAILWGYNQEHFGGLSEWAPSGLSNQALWLDAAPANVTLNSGDVSGWTDLSSAGNDGSQSTSAFQPLYEATGWNSTYPSLLINGESAGEHLIFDAGTLATALSGDDTPYTITLVCQVMNAPTNARYLLSAASSASNQPFILMTIDASDRYSLEQRDDAGVFTGANEAVSSFDTARHQFTLHFNGTTRTLYKDGVSIGTSAAALGALTLDRITLGRLRRASAEEGVNFRTPGLTVYTRALSTAELTALWNYNRAHFGGLP